MNLSLRGRVTWSFIIANALVLGLTFTIFQFLNSLNQDLEKISFKFDRRSFLIDEIRIQATSLLKYQRRIVTQETSPQLVDQVLNLSKDFISQLKNLKALYTDSESKAKQIIASMLSYVESLKIFLSKGALFDRNSSTSKTIGDLADKILNSFLEFQDIQYLAAIERDKQIKNIITRAKHTMMIVLIMGFLFTIILALVMPGKIALPFKKIKDAIRELQDCNFDVNIYYSQDDEIGEIAQEMNKMIHSFKVFEELRADRISVENRKFDALANTVGRPVLVSNAGGKLMYMNNRTYSLLRVQSEDVIDKEMTDARIPTCIIETFELAIKRRSKIENSSISVSAKEDGKPEVETFKGYANVIPVRGKENSLDYYLMILSTEVFT